jgi:UrcA family protein
MNTQKQTTRFAALALSGLLLLAAQATPAQAGERPEHSQRTSRTIDVQDVDLSSEQGARWLYRRIVSAAAAVCFGSIERRGVQWFNTQRNDARRCFDDSVNNTLARVNAAAGLDIEQLAGLDRYTGAVAAR